MIPDLPDYTSLVVSRDVLPYDDLSISPGYSRKLLLPDDVPPVLALPWALGPNVPRVNRAQDDGSLNVFVTGGGGGGATGSSYTQSAKGGSAPLLNNVMLPFGGVYGEYAEEQVTLCRYLVGYMASISVLALGAVNIPTKVRVGIGDTNSNGEKVGLYSWTFGEFSNNDTYGLLNQQVTTMFPFPIDLEASGFDPANLFAGIISDGSEGYVDLMIFGAQ